MKIAIVGAGNVGTSLGSGWNKSGHQIIYCVRDTQGEKATALRLAQPYAELADNAQATTADVIVLATPWGQTESAIRACGDLTGKIIIDASNPLKYEDNRLQLDRGFSTSGGEQVAQWAAGARVFKTMNQIGYGMMDHPRLPGNTKPVMFIAGGDNGKSQVLQLVGDLGFEAIDVGPLLHARLLEPYALLWIHLTMNCGLSRDLAFALLRK